MVSVSQHVVAQAVRLGSQAIAVICTAVERWAAEVGAPKRQDRVALHLELDERIKALSLQLTCT